MPSTRCGSLRRRKARCGHSLRGWPRRGSEVMHGEYKMPGGKLIVADPDVRAGRLADVTISGDLFLDPDTALATIDAALEGLPAGSDEAAMIRAIEGALDAEV